MHTEYAYPWLGREPEFSKIDQVLEADVIVCGGGLAGVAAVRAAAEAGARVLLFEKCRTIQGRSGQFAVMDGQTLKHWGLSFKALQEAAIDSLWEASGKYANREIIAYAVKHAGEDFDWYMDGAPEEHFCFSETAVTPAPEGTKLRLIPMRYPFNENYNPADEENPVYPATLMFAPSHIPVLKRNFALAEETGLVEAHFATPARKLLRDPENGRITGVIAVAEDDSVIEAHASAVILATGDFTGDRDMLRAFFPDYKDNPQIPCGVAPDKKPANTGDGHRMGMWAGARLEDTPPALNCHNMGGAMGVTPFLLLDNTGKRYMNEDVTGSDWEAALHRLPGEGAWQIFDSSWPEQIPYMPHGHGCCSHIVPEELEGKVSNGPMDSFASRENLKQSVASGATLTADTLEALVEKMGLPVETALASLTRYNQDAENGTDTEFGKRASRLFPLTKAPFYASRITRAPLLCAHTGLESDSSGRCLDGDGRPISGLYLAGNVQGGRFAISYPTVLPGFSHTMALTYGRLTGRLAAETKIS